MKDLEELVNACWDILSSVCLRKSESSVFSILQYMGKWIFNWPIQVKMIKIFFLFHLIIIIKSEVSTFSIVVTFFAWLCDWSVSIILTC